METKRFKPKYRIKKGDSVVVISGDNKNLKTPKKVLEVLVEEGRVIVEGVNMIKRHSKPTAQNTKGGIIEKEAPINISNIMLWDSVKNVPTKVKIERKDGKVLRISKKTGNTL